MSPDNVGNSWAPEAYYDESIGAYVVYWASKFYDNETDPDHTGVSYNRKLYAITRDFVNFSEPVIWYDEPGFNRIDISVIKEGDTYYSFVKDDADGSPVPGVAPNTTRDIFVEKSTDLLATPYTAWTPVSEELGRKSIGGARFGTGYEGQVVIKANPGDVNGELYSLFLDRYIGSGTGYYAAVTEDLDAEVWTGMTMTIPSNTHHGSVISLNQPEWNKLKGIETADVESTTKLSLSADDNMNLSASVKVTASDGCQAAGKVIFTAGDWSGTASLNEDGVAAITVPVKLLSGSDHITAVYQGYDIVAGSEDTQTFSQFNANYIVVYNNDADNNMVNATICNKTDKDVMAVLYVAAYDNAGRLVAVKTAENNVASGGATNISVDFTLATETPVDSIKAFVWEKDSYAPMVNYTVLNP